MMLPNAWDSNYIDKLRNEIVTILYGNPNLSIDQSIALIMKLSGGKVNPHQVNDIVREFKNSN